jgi:excisionase family DNA binding protein
MTALRRSSAKLALGPPELVDDSEVPMTTNRLTLTVEEAGTLLGISRTLAYELVRRGEIPSLRLGRRVVVPVHALELMVQGFGTDETA